MIYYDRTVSGQIKLKNVLERLWLNSIGDHEDECWVCNLKGSTAGHVRIRLDNKSRMMAHRLAYEAHYAEPIPFGFQVNHHCDNPSCFNPKHLYLGNQKDNMIDRANRDRQNLKRKIPKNKIEYIKQSLKSCKELAKEFGVTPQAISYHKKQPMT
jgi:hypothetical protein